MSWLKSLSFLLHKKHCVRVELIWYFMHTKQICIADYEWCYRFVYVQLQSHLTSKSPKQKNHCNQKWLGDAGSIGYSLLLMVLVGEVEENCSPDSNISNTISFSISG